MAGLTDTTIAASYDQLLIIDRDGGGNTTTHVTVKDGDGDTTFPITLATDAIMITSTNRLEFGDNASYIHQSADGVLDLVSDTEIEINATNIDINGAVDISGATQLNSTVTVGADDQGYDVIFYGDTANANMTWDTSADDLILNDSRLYIDQDANVTALYIDSLCTDSHTVDIRSSSLTTGHLAHLYSNSDSGSTRQLVNIYNANSSASATTCLSITQLANDKAIHIDTGTQDFDNDHGCILIGNNNASSDGPLFRGHQEHTSGGNQPVFQATHTSSNTVTFQVNASGAVGIGAAPTHDLTVHRGSNTNASIAITTDGGGEDSTLFLLEDGTVGAEYGSALVYDGGDNNTYLKTYNNGTASNRITIERDTGNATFAGDVTISGSNLGIGIAPESSQRIKIQGVDNNYHLNVVGGSDGRNFQIYDEWSTGDNKIVISANGNSCHMMLTAGTADQLLLKSGGDASFAGKVGIGASPARPLDVVSSFNGYALKVDNAGDHDAYRGIEIECGQDNPTGTNYAMIFADGSGDTQGTITFSGGTVTYGTFTANHDVELPESDNENGYPYGTLVEHTELFYKQKNGSDTERGILYKVQKSSSAYSKSVLGAYSSKHATDVDENLHQVYVLGDGHIICNGEKGNIEIGDGICSSSTDGEGMKADKMAMIIGIAQEDVSFSGSESKLVAVQYGLQQFTPWENA